MQTERSPGEWTVASSLLAGTALAPIPHRRLSQGSSLLGHRRKVYLTRGPTCTLAYVFFRTLHVFLLKCFLLGARTFLGLTLPPVGDKEQA